MNPCKLHTRPPHRAPDPSIYGFTNCVSEFEARVFLCRVANLQDAEYLGFYVAHILKLPRRSIAVPSGPTRGLGTGPT